ncbi:MAG TPA: DUF6134 family protein [Alphaproteobacteria bacterium]|nr:DUF6134 family protein [Alphaproteobacteria bacterium]
MAPEPMPQAAMPILSPRSVLRRLGLAALILGLIGGMRAPAHALDAPDGKRPFDILINGVKVGRQLLAFHHEGKTLVVENEIDIASPELWHRLADRTLAALRIDERVSEHYMLRCREVWRVGALVEVTTDVNNYDTPAEVDLDATPSGLMVSGSAGRLPAPPGLVPSSLWQLEMTQAQSVLDLDSGRILNVHFSQGADEPLAQGAEDVPARHVTASGELARELWYDHGNGLLLREQYVDRKGQVLEFRYAPAAP